MNPLNILSKIVRKSASQGVLGPVGTSWGALGASWVVLGVSWKRLGGVLETSSGFLERLGRLCSLGLQEETKELQIKFLKASRIICKSILDIKISFYVKMS